MGATRRCRPRIRVSVNMSKTLADARVIFNNLAECNTMLGLTASYLSTASHPSKAPSSVQHRRPPEPGGDAGLRDHAQDLPRTRRRLFHCPAVRRHAWLSLRVCGALSWAFAGMSLAMHSLGALLPRPAAEHSLVPAVMRSLASGPDLGADAFACRHLLVMQAC